MRPTGGVNRSDEVYPLEFGTRSIGAQAWPHSLHWRPFQRVCRWICLMSVDPHFGHVSVAMVIAPSPQNTAMYRNLLETVIGPRMLRLGGLQRRHPLIQRLDISDDRQHDPVVVDAFGAPGLVVEHRPGQAQLV